MPPPASRDLGVRRAVEARFEFVHAIARVDEMRVAIDEPGRHPRATRIERSMRRHVARQVALGAHPGDRLASDADGAVANRAIRCLAAHRREMRAGDEEIERVGLMLVKIARETRAVAREHGILMRMTAVAHDPPPSHHHVPHRGAAGAEYRGIEHRPDGLGGQRGIVGIEHHEIGAASRGNGTRRLPQRLRAAARRRHVERVSHRRIGGPRAHCAPAATSRCDHSSCRNSANGSMQVFESLPTPNAPCASR